MIPTVSHEILKLSKFCNIEKLTNCQVKLFKTEFTSANPRMISFIIPKLYHCISFSMHEVIYINQAIEKEKKFMYSENCRFAAGCDGRLWNKISSSRLDVVTRHKLRHESENFCESKKWLNEEMVRTCWQNFQFLALGNIILQRHPRTLSTKRHSEFCLRKTSTELAWKIALLTAVAEEYVGELMNQKK